jgi:uncharacterized protein YxjI
MVTNLVISNKLLSLRGRMNITDLSDQLMYEAVGEFAFLSPTWRISKGAEQVATVRRKILSFVPTWNINSDIGEFAIKRKLFSFTRKYNVLGGPFSGVLISGNIWDLKFNISNGSETIARATSKILTLRDRHNIEVIKSGKEAELMTVIAMVTLHLERKSETEDSS